MIARRIDIASVFGIKRVIVQERRNKSPRSRIDHFASINKRIAAHKLHFLFVNRGIPSELTWLRLIWMEFVQPRGIPSDDPLGIKLFRRWRISRQNDSHSLIHIRGAIPNGGEGHLRFCEFRRFIDPHKVMGAALQIKPILFMLHRRKLHHAIFCQPPDMQTFVVRVLGM